MTEVRNRSLYAKHIIAKIDFIEWIYENILFCLLIKIGKNNALLKKFCDHYRRLRLCFTSGVLNNVTHHETEFISFLLEGGGGGELGG